MRIITTTLLIVGLTILGSAANAQQRPARFAQDVPETPPAATQQAPRASDASPAAPDCKLVQVSRPNVTASPISIRFEGPNAGDLVKCDQSKSGVKAVRKESNGENAYQVTFTVTNGVGTVAVPLSLTDAKVSQVVCTDRGDGTKHAKYAAQWRGSVPGEIALEALSSYDVAAANKGCGDIIARMSQAQQPR